MLDLEDHPDHLDIQNRGDVVQIKFNETEQPQCAAKSRGRAFTLEELKVSFVM